METGKQFRGKSYLDIVETSVQVISEAYTKIDCNRDRASLGNLLRWLAAALATARASLGSFPMRDYGFQRKPLLVVGPSEC